MIHSVRDAVDRGLAIREQLAKLTAELKEIEGLLVRMGLKGNQEDLKDSEREGRRWLARGSEQFVPVLFTADKIVGSFKRDTGLHLSIAPASGGNLLKFFKPWDGYKNRFDDGKKFRAAAVDLLDKAAPPFITACLARDKSGVPLSDVKVLWDDTEAVV